MHGSEGPRSASSRLVVARGSARARTWSAAAAQEGRAFLLQRGHVLSDPSLATWVIEQCAELIAEHAAELAWSALPVDELWRRLENLQRFFPQPRLVIAHDETLRAFVWWLCGRGLLTRARGEQMLTELERHGGATLARAHEALARRRLGVDSPPGES